MPREGHDPPTRLRVLPRPAISIHVPREGHDLNQYNAEGDALTFQSTCPARGTTHLSRVSPLLALYFNPRAPRGARRAKQILVNRRRNFNPRAPRGARPPGQSQRSADICISIHVPREGHDFCSRLRACPVCHFNPRAPRGARRRVIAPCKALPAISIHVPREGHDDVYADVGHVLHISIHVPREGHDNSSSTPESSSLDFNPRAPRGARRGVPESISQVPPISIHVPREGHDAPTTESPASENLFQSTCPARGTTAPVDADGYAG